MSHVVTENLMLFSMTDICETLFAVFDVEPHKIDIVLIFCLLLLMVQTNIY